MTQRDLQAQKHEPSSRSKKLPKSPKVHTPQMTRAAVDEGGKIVITKRKIVDIEIGL